MITLAMMARGKARAHTRPGAAGYADLASERGGPLTQSIDPPYGATMAAASTRVLSGPGRLSPLRAVQASKLPEGVL